MTHYLSWLILLTATLFSPLSSAGTRAYNIAAEQVRINKIPPRLQWNANRGYSGEVALISAGLYFGQYVSQYDARALACQEKTQESSQLLLGANAHHTACQMRLDSYEWPSFDDESTPDFLSWIKQNVINGCPVLIGVYMNQYRLYHDKKPSAGDSRYDHIVPVTGIASNHSLSDPSYHPDDMIYFSDNGRWGDRENPHYRFSYQFDALQATRNLANSRHGPVYSLPLTDHNYGIAILGVSDLHHDTVRVRLETNLNHETPEIEEGSNIRPEPIPLILTVKLRDLEPNTSYNLYLYDNFESVPNCQFNAHAAQASKMWTIQIDSGSSFTMTYPIESNQTAIFRCVKASAP